MPNPKKKKKEKKKRSTSLINKTQQNKNKNKEKTQMRSTLTLKFYTAKENIDELKRQLTEWEKTFANDVIDEGVKIQNT